MAAGGGDLKLRVAEAQRLANSVNLNKRNSGQQIGIEAITRHNPAQFHSIRKSCILPLIFSSRRTHGREAPDCPKGTPERYRILLDISEFAGAHPRFEDFFRELSRALARIIPFESIGISIYDAARQTTQLFVRETANPDNGLAGQVLPMAGTPASEILSAQRPLYVPDIEKENRFPAIQGILRSQGIRSYCVLPLSTARNRMGGLHFASAQPDAYTVEDIEFMQWVARHTAVILENVLSHESTAASQRELARERDHLRLLLQVNAAVAAKLDTRELFSAISVCLREALNVEYASLALFDAETHQLRRHSLDFPGSGGFLQENEIIPIENTTVGEAFLKAIPVTSRRADIERLQPEVAESVLKEGLNFICAVPLISRERVLGTLNVASHREDAFSETSVKLLEEVACQFAVALDNALAYQHIEALNCQAGGREAVSRRRNPQQLLFRGDYRQQQAPAERAAPARSRGAFAIRRC